MDPRTFFNTCLRQRHMLLLRQVLKKNLKAWDDFPGSWAPMIARSNHRTLFIIFIFYPFLNALFDKVKK